MVTGGRKAEGESDNKEREERRGKRGEGRESGQKLKRWCGCTRDCRSPRFVNR